MEYNTGIHYTLLNIKILIKFVFLNYMASKYAEDENFIKYMEREVDIKKKKDLIRKLKEIVNFLESSI
tara:strand:- start:2247 stop:2450 length:204 start_codon:yes stop_codon:yes gene_type:complete